jgi:hypothetical protein
MVMIDCSDFHCGVTRLIIFHRASLFKRLSRVPFREHRSVRADPRFLQLVGVAQVKLGTRPKELDPQVLANTLNSACGHAISRALARLMKTLYHATVLVQVSRSSGTILGGRLWRCLWTHAWRRGSRASSLRSSRT